MKKLGVFQKFNNEYIVFYDEERKSLNYFYKSKVFKDMECWIISYDKVKYILPKVKTPEEMVENYQLIWNCLSHFKPNKVENYVKMQVMDQAVWDEAEKAGFKDFIAEFKFAL